MIADGSRGGTGGDPLISVIVATYLPGEGFRRVMESLDAQTLPQDRFETIVVDDGSPDDTADRLSGLAAARPNLRIERIEHSGWPSRPRNVGVSLARGEWVFFMDHDDSLYPDALRRMAEYAAETRADLLSPKESKTSDPWWDVPPRPSANVPNALEGGDIGALLPMVPHKLYRRAFLEECAIRFPEGRRQLWEDIHLNVAAWRHARRVAVLEDTPVYLWHSSSANNSKTYGPRDEEFWDRLDELFAFVDRTLDGPEYAPARRSALLHQYTSRVLVRYSRALGAATAEEAAMGLRRARGIQERYVPEEWDLLVGKHVRARSILLRAERPDLLRALSAADDDTASDVRAGAAEWRQGALHLAVEGRWTDGRGRPVALRRDGDRLVRELPEELLAALPAEVVDLSDTIECFQVDVGVRDRPDRVTWALPVTAAARWEDVPDGRVVPVLRGEAVLDPSTAGGGAALASHSHDVVGRMQWDGVTRSGAVTFRGRSAPATVGDRPAVAYRSQKDSLALDLGGALRNPIADGGAVAGPVEGSLRGLVLPLPRIRTFGAARIPAALRLTRVDAATTAPVVLPGSLRIDDDGARIEAGTTTRVPAGLYEIAYRTGEGAFTGRRRAQVQGRVLVLLPRDGSPLPPPPARKLMGALRRRLTS